MRTIEGRNPVIEAMKAGTKIKKITIQEGMKEKAFEELADMARSCQIPVETASRLKLNQMASSEVHQGVIAQAEDYHYVELDEIIEYARSRGEEPFVILLDEIQDPHNLGSIIRTANVAGVHGIVIPKHRAAEITPAVCKTSAGAVEYTRVARVTNIVRAMEELQEAGLWIGGGALEGDQTLYQANLRGPLGLVIGSEGEGIRRLVRERCDFLIKIPMFGQIESLNASVAAGIMIYEAVRQRSKM